MRTAAVVIVAVGIALSLSAAGADTGSRRSADECAEVKAKIREIQDRMRAGYTARQGRRYDATLRRLKEKRRRVCR